MGAILSWGSQTSSLVSEKQWNNNGKSKIGWLKVGYHQMSCFRDHESHQFRKHTLYVWDDACSIKPIPGHRFFLAELLCNGCPTSGS